MSRVDTSYEPRVHSARTALLNDQVLSEILSPNVSPHLLECFLVEWLARVPYMTTPAATFLSRAGQRCTDRGMKRIGPALLEFARREAAESQPDVKNLRAVVRALNARSGANVDAAALLAQRPTVTMRAYRILHEEVLAGDMCYGEIAIAYEMERASSLFGLALLLTVQRVLGPNASLRLSGLRKRAPQSVERTTFLERALAELLMQVPEATEPLAEIGAGALDIYRHFLRECVEQAHARANATAPRSGRATVQTESHA
jgi:hypothetical protein